MNIICYVLKYIIHYVLEHILYQNIVCFVLQYYQIWREEKTLFRFNRPNFIPCKNAFMIFGGGEFAIDMVLRTVFLKYFQLTLKIVFKISESKKNILKTNTLTYECLYFVHMVGQISKVHHAKLQGIVYLMHLTWRQQCQEFISAKGCCSCLRRISLKFLPGSQLYIFCVLGPSG